MSMIALAAAALLAPPIPTNMEAWMRPQDMPAYHQRGGVTRAAYLRLTVRPDGRVPSCDVENSEGDPDLASMTCALVIQRANFQPAKGADGAPAFGVYRTRMVWAVGSSSRSSYAGDLELDVSSLPAGERSPVAIRLALAVDAAGRVSSCAAESSAASAAGVRDGLVAVACKQMVSQYQPLAAKNDAGQPVASIQTGVVVFRTPSRS